PALQRPRRADPPAPSRPLLPRGGRRRPHLRQPAARHRAGAAQVSIPDRPARGFRPALPVPRRLGRAGPDGRPRRPDGEAGREPDGRPCRLGAQLTNLEGPRLTWDPKNLEDLKALGQRLRGGTLAPE